MRHGIAAALAGLALIAVFGVRASAAEPATAPVAKADDVPALIKRLGADDPKVRDAATQQLRRLGQIATPALTEARGSDDPEVASRADLILRQIQQDAQPSPPARTVTPPPMVRVRPPRLVLPPPGAPRLAPRGNVREVNTVDGGRRVKIREDADGLSVTTVEKTPGGSEVTRTIRTKDAEALKREFPDVYPLYEKHAAGLRGAEPARLGGALIDPLDASGNVDVERMMEEARRMIEEHRPLIEEQRRLIDEQMREARKLFEDQLSELREDQQKK